jgi:hypothetical protein
MNYRITCIQEPSSQKKKEKNLGIPHPCSHQVGPTHHQFFVFPLLNLCTHDDTPNQAKSCHTLPIQEEYNNVNFFLILVCEAIGTAATPGLLCQPRVTVKIIVEKQMECRLAGETKVLGENLPQRHFCPSQNPT